MGWLKRISIRRQVVREMQFQQYVLWQKQSSLEVQLGQIEARSQFGSRVYRIKYMELVDICEKLDMLDHDLKRFDWWFILTGWK